MRYGAMNHPARPVFSELAEIDGLGFDYLELTLDPPEAHYSQIRKLAADLRAELHRREMDVVCHMPTFVSLADLTDSIRQASVGEVLASLEVAAELQARHVVLHPAYISGMGPFVMDLARQHALDSLAAIAGRAAELGLVVCLENMFPRTRFCVEPADFQLVFEQFPSLQLTLDIGHGCIGSPQGSRVLHFIQEFAERVYHLHVSDNFGEQDDHLPVGAGSIPFASILAKLKETRFDRTVTFEIFTDDRQQLPQSRRNFENQWSQA